MSTIKKNAVSRLFADFDDEPVAEPTPLPQPRPAEAGSARKAPLSPVKSPPVATEPMQDPVTSLSPGNHPLSPSTKSASESKLNPLDATAKAPDAPSASDTSLSPVKSAELAPEPPPTAAPSLSPVNSTPAGPAPATATKTKVTGVKTHRARGRLSGFRAALGVQIIVPLPQNVHEAYTRQCAAENITLQSGVIDSIRDLVAKAHERPEILAFSEPEAERMIGWLETHGTGFLRLVIPRDLAEAMDALPHKRLADGEWVSRKLIATRAVLNRVKARLG